MFGTRDPALCAGAFAPNPSFQDVLLPIDLTRGGFNFHFHGHSDIKQVALYLQDAITWGNWAFNLGLRGDLYRGIVSDSQPQPRIGVAWHPMKKWVFRGGFTVNTIDIRFPLSRDQFDEYSAQNVQAQATGDPRPIYNLSQGPQPIKFNILSGNTAPFVTTTGNYSTRNVSWWDPNLRNPYVMNWQAGVQYEINSRYLLDIAAQIEGEVAVLRLADPGSPTLVQDKESKGALYVLMPMRV